MATIWRATGQGNKSGRATGGSVAISQSGYNSDNQATNRIGGSGSMLFAGSVSEQMTVTVAGNTAAVNHTTTNFVGYASVIGAGKAVTLLAP
jgi:hypothetical protein